MADSRLLQRLVESLQLLRRLRSQTSGRRGQLLNLRCQSTSGMRSTTLLTCQEHQVELRMFGI